MTNNQLPHIPDFLMHLKYDGSKHPGNTKVLELKESANCQVFAYALLHYYGIQIPPFRSSELWTDECHTKVVSIFQPLDLLLFNDNPNSWGAHVGVYLGDDQVIHLSKVIGKPIVWDLTTFGQYAKYQCFIGAKRGIKTKTATK